MYNNRKLANRNARRRAVAEFNNNFKERTAEKF